MDESLLRRSPLVRTVAPLFGFFRSRAGETLDRFGVRPCYMILVLL